MTNETGVFFHDMRDFRASLETILSNADVPGRYTPQKWVRAHYGNDHAGPRLLKFVEDHFLHRVKLPKGTTMLLT